MLKHKIARPDVGRPSGLKPRRGKKKKTTAPRTPLAESTANATARET